MLHFVSTTLKRNMAVAGKLIWKWSKEMWLDNNNFKLDDRFAISKDANSLLRSRYLVRHATREEVKKPCVTNQMTAAEETKLVSDWFGFGLKTLNWKLFYHHLAFK